MHDRHYERTALVDASPATLFTHLDEHARLAGHMTMSSWMMAGSRMDIRVDEQAGRAVGSRIRITGSAVGQRLHAEEVVTEREAPRRKVWETVGEVRLLVIGSYRMGFDIAPEGSHSRLRIFIDYDLPARGAARWLGRALGGWYARWCTDRMLADAVRAFAPATGPDRASPGGST